jgi:hypothetical protein
MLEHATTMNGKEHDKSSFHAQFNIITIIKPGCIKSFRKRYVTLRYRELIDAMLSL